MLGDFGYVRIVLTAWAGYFMGAVKGGIPTVSWSLLRALAGI